jgi:hypothetical protein
MMYLPIQSNAVTQVSRNPARTLPRPQVQRTLVTQPVNLRPLGNTVSMTVPAEMPFLSRNVTVVTQASGGMAKPDPRMTTRPQFLPMNGLGADVSADEITAWYRAYDAEGAAGKAITPEKEVYWRGVISQDKDKKAAASSASTSAAINKGLDIFTTTLTAGANVASDMQKAKIAAANAQALKAQTEIERIRSQSFSQDLMSRFTDPAKAAEAMGQRKGITIPLLIIGGGALAVALFLFLKKKNAAAAA